MDGPAASDVIGDDAPEGRRRRPLVVGIGAVLIALLVWVGLWLQPSDTSVPSPRPPALLSATGQHEVSTEGDLVGYSFEMANRSDVDVEVFGGGRSGPGLDLVASSLTPGPGGYIVIRPGPDEPRPLVVPPDGTVTLALSYRLRDCAQLNRGSWPVPVMVRAGGVAATQSVLPPSGPDGQQWQLTFSQPHC